MAAFVWVACHRHSVNSQLCWNVQTLVTAFITAMFHPFVNIRDIKFVYPLCKTATERCLLSSQLPRSDHIKHSPRAKGRWPKVAIISLELIDWLWRSCFRFIHHPPNSERCLTDGRTLLLWFEATGRWWCKNRVAPILLNKSKQSWQLLLLIYFQQPFTKLISLFWEHITGGISFDCYQFLWPHWNTSTADHVFKKQYYLRSLV